MKVMVTGGAGFIGSTLTELLLDDSLISKPEEVWVLDALTYAGKLENLSECFAKSNFHFVHGDINDLALVSSIIENCDVVINLAAETHVDRSISEPTKFIETNVNGTLNLLNAVKRKPSVKFVQVSTDEVYGSISEGFWSEETPLAPNSPYSASKAAADLLCLSYFKTYDLDISITRCSNNYGPRQFPEKLIPLAITKILKGEKVPVYGNGLNQREWIHVGDHAEAIWRVATKGKSGEVYNIGSGIEFTNLEIVSKLANRIGGGIDVIEFVEDRSGHDFRYALDSGKIESELNFVPQINFDEGLNQTIDWYINSAQK
jgi:dTDP-glucose 4,6-dehydratase